jgi:hypothetical protein
MADKYHYDSKGNYIGRTSDSPPPQLGFGEVLFIVCGLVLLYVLFFFGISFFFKSNSSGSDKNAVTDSPTQGIAKVQANSTPEPQPDPNSAIVHILSPKPEPVQHEMSIETEQSSISTEDRTNSSDSRWVVPKED